MLPFNRLWYGDPNAISNAIGYAEHYRRSHDAVIRVSDGIRYGVWFAIPQRTEWQRVGNEIDAAMIFCGGGLRKRAF